MINVLCHDVIVIARDPRNTLLRCAAIVLEFTVFCCSRDALKDALEYVVPRDAHAGGSHAASLMASRYVLTRVHRDVRRFSDGM